MKVLALLCVPVSFFSIAFGQSTAAPQIELAVPQVVAGQPFNVNVVVEAEADQTPVPTGAVTLDFGDGTGPLSGTLTNSIVVLSHTFANPGAFSIKASYAGDSNYAPISMTQSGVVLTSKPAPAVYNAFGDSITAGAGVTAGQYRYPNVIASTEGWTPTVYAAGGDKAPDQCAKMYGTAPAAGNIATLLIGQNDDVDVGDYGDGPQYSASLLACGAWVMLTPTGADGTPTKLTAQDAQVTKSGAWVNSDLYTAMGMKTLNAGDSVSGYIDGSTLYAGLTVNSSTDYSVNFVVDGQSQGTVTPQFYYAGTETAYVAWGVRLPLATSGRHSFTITCAAPGAAGCYVDWIGGNGVPALLPRPALWYGTPFVPLLGQGSDLYTSLRDAIIPVQSELAADGLSSFLADTYNWFDGYTQPQCMYDYFHPNDCGNAILAATFMSSMNRLLASAPHIQLSSSGLHDFVAVGDGLTDTYGVKVTNDTGASYPFQLSFSGSPEFSHYTNCLATLAVGSSCELIFNFAPQAGETGWVNAQWSLSGAPQVTVSGTNGGTLEGNAYNTAALTLNTSKHNFGNVNVGTTSSSFGLVVVNPNAKPFTGSLAWTGATSQFTVSGNCVVPMPAFSNCVESLAFKPTATGAMSASLTITPTSGEVISPSNTVVFVGNGQ